MDLNGKHEAYGSIVPHGHAARASYLTPRPHTPRERDEITLREIWQIVLKRRAIFLICVGLGILVAVVASLILPTRYEGVARLTIDFDSPSSFDMDALAKAAGVDSETRLQTQVNVLQTDALAWDVIKQLRLDQRSETAHRKFILGPAECLTPPDQSFDSITPECRKTLLDEFHSRLHVQSIPKTEIIEIRFRCKSRELAASVVNTLADTYVEQGFQTKYLAAMRPMNWLVGQLNDVKKDAELAEEKLISYQRKTGIFGADENHNIVIERLNTVNQQLVDARANRIVHEARFRVAMTGDPEALAELTPGSVLQVLHTQEADLKNQYAQLEAKYGDAYPKVIQVKAQLEKASEATKQELDHTRGKIKDQYEAALKSESMLHDEFEKQKLEAYDTNEATSQAALLKHDVDATRELYEQLVKRLKEAGIIAGLKATNVTVIDPAAIPVSPVEPRPMLNLGLGMFAGSLCGLALSFLLNNVDTTIESPNDLADVGALPALGVVPRLSDAPVHGFLPSAHRNGLNGAARIATLERPESEMADAYRSLRTVLLLPNGGPPPKVHLITSPLPREGKTTTSVNTAVVFAQKNRRVLLVDGDLRGAGLNRCLNLRRNGGLSAALTGGNPRDSYQSHPELPNLFILPAGSRPSKAPDLLDSDRMRELVSTWRQEFDQVVIDAPPLIGLSDAAILATMADTVVLVLRAKQSRRQDLFRAQEILARVDANVAGAVINDFDLKAHDYYGNSTSLYARYFNDNGRKRNHVF